MQKIVLGEKKIIGYRPTWAEVKLSNLVFNYRQIKKLLSPGVRMMVTVKADAYGHGLIPVARKLVSCGVDYLGVASIDEGIRLRKAKVKIPVLVLGIVLKEDIEPLFTYRLTPAVCSEELAGALNKRAKKEGQPVGVHIKVDTGMRRLGVAAHDSEAFIKKVSRLKFLALEGVFTHFAFADMNREFTDYQISLFSRLVRRLEASGIRFSLVHAANSMGAVDFRHSHFNMVRPGLVIYGLRPKENLRLRLKPLLSLKTKIVYLKKVPKGQGVSYGHIYTTKKNTTIATLPIGYGDGYPRNLSNIAPVLVKGRFFKVSGRVCMDQIMVDTGNLPLSVGEEVVLIGRQGKKIISAEELARLSGTIPYEIVCGLGSRVPRLYRD